MKKLLALFLCCAMLFMTSCGIPQFDTTPTEEPQPEEIVPTDIPEEDTAAIPETPKLTVRENPASDRTEENIEPFGNTPGHVIARGVEELFPKSRFDLNRLVFETDRVLHAAQTKTYVVDGYVEKVEKLLDVMETTTGLSFTDHQIQLCLGDSGKRTSDFEYVNFPEPKYYLLQVCQGDALLGNGYEMISMFNYSLMWSQAPQVFNDVMYHGCVVYMTYDILSQLEVSDPEFAALFAGSHLVYSNYYLFDPNLLYSNSVNYWLENGYPYEASNGSAAMGFWLMKYLDDAYGDYTRWLTAYNADNGELDVNGQIQLLKDTYGEDVLDGFYPWLRENLDKNLPWEIVPDRTALHTYVCYPMLTESDTLQELLNGEYADICISFAEYRHYLTQVKEFTIDALTLIKYSDAEVLLYDAQGNFLQATTGTAVGEETYLVSLDDACYVRFPEAGYHYALLDLEYTYP